MSRLLGLPNFGGSVGFALGAILTAMIASFAMHLLRLGWERKFGVTIVDG